ncbi:MAG: type VI secretion system tip protein VgrG [Deltaproteobacteria bacterium]|nr:type VI secretion system tip protein VgrG [Deltaproteobacteria bacterium]
MSLVEIPLTRIELTSSDHLLEVRRFHVEESMNGLFRAVLHCVSPRAEVDLSKHVGTKAEFVFVANRERRFRGLLADMTFQRIADDAQGLASYELTLVPTLWRLTQRRSNRLFQHVTIPDIVTALLEEWSIAHEWQIDRDAYPKLELRTQYAETDFAFMSRLLEEAGIAFWMRDDGEQDATLVLGDAPQSNPARKGGPLAFIDEVAQAFAGRTEFVTNVQLKEASRPGRVTLRDHDFARPRSPLYAHAESDRAAERAHEVYEFAPGVSLQELAGSPASRTPVADDLGVARHVDGRTQSEAKLRVEALHATRRLLSFETSVNDLSPGVVLAVNGHPRDDISSANEFLVLSSSFTGEVAKPHEWRFAATAVNTKTPFRPERRTPKPRMYGIQTAVVVGESGGSAAKTASLPGAVGKLHGVSLDEGQASARLVDEDIYVDEHGRVRVQFPWDREHAYGSESSTWMRVSQGWAGVGYGMFAVPRVGHEVLVAFVDGDPDCPIVVGRVHDMREPVPFALPENKTVSTWKSASSPGGEGFNELRFDDAAGREHVFMQAQRDMDRLIKNDLKEAVGGSAMSFTQGVSSSAVGAVRTQYTNLDDVDVTGLNRTSYVGLNRAASVGAEDSVQVGSRWSVTVARGLTRRLVTEIETAAQSLGSTLRGLATTAMGGIQRDPLVPASSAALAEFGNAAFARLRDVGDALRGFKLDPGPPPTSLEIVDRRITFTTGEASIVLDGPNVTISAQGVVAVHAHDNVSLLGEREIAIGARGKAALVSATDEIILQSSKTLHLNPYGGGGLAPIKTPQGQAGGEAPSYNLCGDCGAPKNETDQHVCAATAGPEPKGDGLAEGAADAKAAREVLDALAEAAAPRLSKDDRALLDALGKAKRALEPKD